MAVEVMNAVFSALTIIIFLIIIVSVCLHRQECMVTLRNIGNLAIEMLEITMNEKGMLPRHSVKINILHL